MTTEEKAKAYDEALEKAKCLIANEETNVPVFYVENIKDIFPELKESEDEKIRKDIIVYLQYSIAFDKSFLDKKYNWSQKDCSKWIAWLEKQGEQNPVPDWMPKFLDELRLKKNYFDWDEHKEIEGGILAIIKWMNPNYFNEKDGEQKSVDKVEPKFHEGEWITIKE